MIRQSAPTTAPTKVPVTPMPEPISTPIPVVGCTTDGLVPIDIPETLIYHAERKLLVVLEQLSPIGHERFLYALTADHREPELVVVNVRSPVRPGRYW